VISVRAWFTRTGDTGPDFYRREGGNCEGTLWSSGNAVANVLVTGFRFEERFNNAGIE